MKFAGTGEMARISLFYKGCVDASMCVILVEPSPHQTIVHIIIPSMEFPTVGKKHRVLVEGEKALERLELGLVIRGGCTASFLTTLR